MIPNQCSWHWASPLWSALSLQSSVSRLRYESVALITRPNCYIAIFLHSWSLHSCFMLFGRFGTRKSFRKIILVTVTWVKLLSIVLKWKSLHFKKKKKKKKSELQINNKRTKSHNGSYLSHLPRNSNCYIIIHCPFVVPLFCVCVCVLSKACKHACGSCLSGGLHQVPRSVLRSGDCDAGYGHHHHHRAVLQICEFHTKSVYPCTVSAMLKMGNISWLI